MMGLVKSISNFFRGSANDLAERIKDPVRDGKLAVEDSKARIRRFTEKIAGLVSHNKALIKQRESISAEIRKYQDIAIQAANNNDRNDARKALELKAQASSRYDILSEQIEKGEKLVAKLKVDLEMAKGRVITAENNICSLEARQVGAKIRQELAQSTTEFGSKESLAGLNELDLAVNREESLAEAWEEMAEENTPEKSLEDKYQANDPGIEDELNKLMGK